MMSTIERGPVLLVEDDPGIRQLYRLILEMAGYQVLEAGSGAEGMRVFTEAEVPVAAAVLDLSLPDMRGDDLLTRMRDLRPDLPAIIASGDLRTGREPATALYLSKPFHASDLLDRVRELLGPD